MATLQQPYRPEDDEQPQTPGGGLITGATASGGGQPTQAKPTSSGVFQNIGTYLKGAEGKSATLSGQIAGHIEEPAKLARTGANEATGAIREDIAKIPDRSGLTQRVIEDPSSLSQEDRVNWKKFASGTYEGPTITDQYTKPLDYGTEAETRGKAAGQRGGYEGFERQVIQRPMSPFERSLDVHGAKYYAPQPMQRAAKFATETPGYVTNQRDTAQELIDTGVQTAKDRGAKATKDVLDYANKWRTGLGTRETEAETRFGSAQKSAIDTFNALAPNDAFTMDPANPPEFMSLLFGDRAGEVITAIRNSLQPGTEWQAPLRGYLPPGTMAPPPGLQYGPPSSILDVQTELTPEAAIGPANVLTADDVADAQALQDLLDKTGIDLSGITNITPITQPVEYLTARDPQIDAILEDLGLTRTAQTDVATENLLETLHDIDAQLGGLAQGWMPPEIRAIFEQSDRFDTGQMDDIRMRLNEYERNLRDHKSLLLGQPSSRPPTAKGTGMPVT